MSEEKFKKRRSANFSASEIDLLCSLIVKYGGIIESKKSDSIAWKEKCETWVKLTCEFNNQNIGPPRLVTTLRGKYETFKKELRKKAAQHRQDLYKTGGGTPEVPCLTPSEEKIFDIINLSVVGLPGRYDDDALNETNIIEESEEEKLNEESTNIKKLNEESTNIEKLNKDEKLNEEIIVITVCDEGPSKNVADNEKENDSSKWKNWNPKALKSTPSKGLQVNRKKQFLTKVQASQKIVTLTDTKRELVGLQIDYLKKMSTYEEQQHVLKISKEEENLKSIQLDIEIKEIEKKIKEETLRKLMGRNNSEFNF